MIVFYNLKFTLLPPVPTFAVRFLPSINKLIILVLILMILYMLYFIVRIDGFLAMPAEVHATINLTVELLHWLLLIT